MITFIPYIFGLLLNLNYTVNPGTRLLVPKYYRGDSNNFYNSIVSSYHCLNVVLNSILYLIYYNDSIFYHALSHSLVYFNIDTIVLLLEIMLVEMKKINIIFVIHHLISLYFVSLVNMKMILPDRIFYIGSLTYFCELPIIFLNYTKYLYKTNQKNTRKYLISNRICKLLYFFCRIVNLPIIFWDTYEYTSTIEKLILLFLIVINYVWFSVIIYK